MAGKHKDAGKRNGNGANLGFEETLWLAADKLRGHVDAAEYKHIVLGLIFLKYISDAFQERYTELVQGVLLEDGSRRYDPYADPEDRDEYTAEGVFWVPEAARWPALQAQAKSPRIAAIIDEALGAIE